MTTKTHVYEEIQLADGWRESASSSPYEGILRFLKNCVGDFDEYRDGSFYAFLQEIGSVEGPKGGKAKEVLLFKGVRFEVTRRPLRTYHSSQKGRWEVCLKLAE